MQTEVSQEMELLREDGRIVREGFARRPVWRYRRGGVRAPWWRIKEWDYYAVIDQARGVGVTITFSDLGYAGLIALCFVDVKHGLFRQVDTLKPLTRGKLGLAEDVDAPHVLEYVDKTLSVRLERTGNERRLAFSDAGGSAGSGGKAGAGARLEGEIVLHQPPEQERIAIATSWAKKRTAFYYNQKINCMPAQGWMRAEGDEYRFSPETSFGVLDWGRGRWTYRNRWYWASASGLVDGVPFGFNLGYGFTDRSPASENMLFYGGDIVQRQTSEEDRDKVRPQSNLRAHKLEDVRFEFDADDYLKPWKVHSSDGRLEMIFEPTVNRAGRFNLLLIESDQNQVFGYYRGRAVLDDGRTLEFSGLAGFAEEVFNRW
ncbi:MAG: DUF2804 domain-containing protein [Spirochaetaceae bacterium]|nr:DUF2804 domain-containing protein [Spirochaetaceae bacterium]MCF7949873.1 DUF2804 domain-containing protein [Spirochaetia bacterium]MCF7951676.1 DUF2804 domain-containing protein [Spirochaetaceae bacterium]